ncbi:TolC family protein (plasmid) [Verrucomicrobiaceae bacterium 227]
MTFLSIRPVVAGTLVACLGFSSCTTQTTTTALSPETNPVPEISRRNDPTSEPQGLLSLGQAIALTLARSPELPSQAWDIRIEEAAALQAATRPNPELGVTLENAFGTGSVSGFNSSEETISLSQTIELGRKRAKRMAVARQNLILANQAYRLKKAGIVADLSNAFVELLAAQQQYGFAQERAAMIKSLMATQLELFSLGKISETERDSGATALTLAEVEVSAAKSEVEVARKTVSSFWGNSSPEFELATGKIDLSSGPAPIVSYQRQLTSSPIVRYREQVITRSRAALELENSNRTPDLTVGVGGRRFEDSDETAAVLEFSVPLPIFDQNKGNIEKARAELGKAVAEETRVLGGLRRELGLAHSRHTAAYSQARALVNEAVPSARKNYQRTLEGYRLGKFTYLDVRAARELLIETQQKALQARIRYHQTLINLETISGQTL